MRIATAILLTGLAVPALADELPLFRQGLWEFNRSMDSGGKPVTLASQKCTNPTEDMKKKNASAALAGCKTTPLARNGNTYSFSADCIMQGVAIQSKSTIKALGDSAYQVDIETTQSGQTSKEHLEAKRVGEC